MANTFLEDDTHSSSSASTMDMDTSGSLDSNTTEKIDNVRPWGDEASKPDDDDTLDTNSLTEFPFSPAPSSPARAPLIKPLQPR